MDRGNTRYIWQQPAWPHWEYDEKRLTPLLTAVHHEHGLLQGRLRNLGLGQSNEATLATLTSDVLKSSEIEGEILDPDTVRSSLARRLGIPSGALHQPDMQVEGVVSMVLDATQNFNEPLSDERLFNWHSGLFPTGYSGDFRILVGTWRDDASGPMQVVSGPLGHEKVHYEAPPAGQMPKEMSSFLDWFNKTQNLDPFVKAGLAHLWFVTLHPFEDGNGRIGRAVSDMVLAQGEKSKQRFYSLSAQIRKDRENYYRLLERTQKDSLDVTGWLEWFLSALLRAQEGAESLLDEVLLKARFWQHWAETSLNSRQIELLNRLLDGFDGNLTNRKWAVIAKCSSDTALRDITELLDKGVLMKAAAGGRSTHYQLRSFG